MIPVTLFNSKLKEFMIAKLDKLAKENGVIYFIKPFLTRAIDNNFDKIDKITKLITDKEGNLDAKAIIGEMIENIKTSPIFDCNLGIGTMEIGEGKLKLNIEAIHKAIIFNTEDLEDFKNTLIG
jgi:hypothetical protein